MLTIRYKHYEALRAHGEETYPHECCGVLLGKSQEIGNTVHEIVHAGNTRTDSAHNRYHIAPQELVKIQRQARELDLDIVGFYHSHPDHPAQWSKTDFAEAHWMGCSYIITAVERGKAAITNSFLLSGTFEDDKSFLDEGIEIDMRSSEQEEFVQTSEQTQGEDRMKIHIPTPLRAYTGGLETVAVSASSITTALDALTTQYPALRQHLFTPEGKTRSFVNIYLNDDDVRYLPEKEETPVQEADELTIIPSIAGGCCL